MPICQHKNTINDSQDNMFPLQPSYPATAVPVHYNITKVFKKDFKTFKIKFPKNEMNKSLEEIQENQTGNWRK